MSGSKLITTVGISRFLGGEAEAGKSQANEASLVGGKEAAREKNSWRVKKIRTQDTSLSHS